ncbi:hypothetical protein QCA50_019356 [Cerrena zonata]|uniref:Uncharacterized protein n=1 Tax=Cerrena zonata TaxID=2478898 RepID=A0AAW0FLS7_9APHY
MVLLQLLSSAKDSISILSSAPLGEAAIMPRVSAVDSDACFVVLGGPDAGIHTLNEWPSYIPSAKYGGPCFPIYIYCRSEEDAERAWQLQAIAEVMEKRSEQQVAFAFMTSVVACNLFEDDANTSFYGGFFGISRKRVVFFSWDEANPYVQHFRFPRTFVQRAQSFVNTLVYLCLGPSCGAPGIHNPVEYVRPKLVQRIVPVKHAKPIVPPSEPMTSAGRPVVVVSDDSDSDEENPTLPPEPSPPPPAQSERILTIPTWVTRLLKEGNTSNDLPVMHVRDIGGNIIRTYTTCPKGVEVVPCLGGFADSLVDLLGYMPSTICCLHSMYLIARQSSGMQREEFVEMMAEYGMPLFHAAIFWRAIQINPGEPVATRERFMLSSEL